MAEIHCPRCSRPVPSDVLNTGTHYVCGGCSRSTLMDVYPAAARAATQAENRAAVEGTATCFFHEGRAAQAACDGCGRYVCALCDVPVGQEHLCPECLLARHRHPAEHALPNERKIWDRGALLIAMLSWPLALFTLGLSGLIAAPVVIYLVIRHRRTPGSLVDRAWPRFTMAVILSLVSLGLFVAMIVGFVLAVRYA